MPAIPYKKTATSDGTWDGPANKARLSNDESDLRGAFAWVDGSADPTTKDAYKGIHHEVAADGSPGAANLTACSAVIAALNGGRGGFDVPDADREGIHAHVAHHLEDAGKDAPELKSLRRVAVVQANRSPSSFREERLVSSRIEVRDAKDGDGPMICGYAAVFDQPSEIMSDWGGNFREYVGQGAFAKTLNDGADVRALWNHDPNFVLGRTKSGTLRVFEDDHGLRYEAKPPPTQWAADLCASMRRGDVDQSSFGFRCLRDRWGTGMDDEGDAIDERTLLEVQLFDVSPVTFPAYPQTDSGVRTALAVAGFDLDILTRVVVRGYRGLALNTRDREAIRAAIDYLTRYLPGHEATTALGAPVRTGHPLTIPQSPAPALPSHADDDLETELATLTKFVRG